MKGNYYMAGGLITLLGSVGLLFGHISADRHLVMSITVVGMLALAHVLGKFK